MPIRLPGGDELHIPDRKVVDYLLSPTHPAGRGKAAWFLAHGFSLGNRSKLADALRQHGFAHPVANVEDTAFGTRYTVEGPLECPDGRSPLVRSVWFGEPGAAVLRFVTAYPLRRSIDD